MSVARSDRGFTLVEVMMAVAILSFGVVMLYSAFFVCIDAVTYASNRLNAQMWAQNKFWEERESLLRNSAVSRDGLYGSVSFNGRDFEWQESAQSVDDGLMQLGLALSWKEAAKFRKLAYSAYVAL
ncbi:MAG TPA: hypothetical protein DCL35_06280 [Candidatus Omnitrophica bacterium]|nr:hypothetical protein [Candidatus Omnitrophota bacterium]